MKEIALIIALGFWALVLYCCGESIMGFMIGLVK